jgi:hypothetical protein
MKIKPLLLHAALLIRGSLSTSSSVRGSKQDLGKTITTSLPTIVISVDPNLSPHQGSGHQRQLMNSEESIEKINDDNNNEETYNILDQNTNVGKDSGIPEIPANGDIQMHVNVQMTVTRPEVEEAKPLIMPTNKYIDKLNTPSSDSTISILSHMLTRELLESKSSVEDIAGVLQKIRDDTETMDKQGLTSSPPTPMPSSIETNPTKKDTITTEAPSMIYYPSSTLTPTESSEPTVVATPVPTSSPTESVYPSSAPANSDVTI